MEVVFTSVFVVLTEVSFFKESGKALVSFLSESALVLVTDELVVTESAPADPLPLQAANDVAIAKASKPVFNVFFISSVFKMMFL